MSNSSNSVRNQLELDLLQILQLDIVDEDTSDKIITDLINNGRQSLVQHRDDIIEEIYLDVMKDHSQLLDILKNAVSNRWSSILYPSYSWLQSFIEQYKTKSFDLYNQIITRQAEFGRQKFINSNDNGEQLLFIIIQFIFNLTDEKILDGYTFNRVWYTLITTGLEGLQQLNEFIEMNDIIKHKNILFQALREYFRPELFSILSKCKIINCRDLYDFILDKIAEYGWRLGLDHIHNKITPRMYKEFMKHIEIIVPIPSLGITTKEFTNKYLTINDRLLDIKSWTYAGEFLSQSLIIKSIIDRYYQHKNLTLFIQDCFIPIMYLLKRQENLQNFIQLVQRLCHHLSIDYLHIHLRIFIHVLLSNSDQCLRRILLNQLQQRNVVPFLQPGSLSINSDIISIWDYSRPCLLSFGIGPCQGKSSLLNDLFNTQFEIHHKENLYFQQTIDIDFGLNFSSISTFYLADTHGIITKECFTKFQSIFQGYLIHIDETYMKQYPTLLNEYLSLIIESDKFRLIIVHNSKSKNKISIIKQSIVLPNMIHINQCSKQFLVEDIREEICKRTKDIMINIEKIQISMEELSVDFKLMNKYVREYLTKMSRDKKPWDNEIDFPFYMKFSSLCYQKKQKRKQAFFEAKENIGETVEILNQLFVTSSSSSQDENHVNRKSLSSLGNAFEGFVEILQLQTIRRFLILDYLSSKLRNDVSMEILWRNVIICYDQCSLAHVQVCVLNAYIDSIKAGFPFEIIDGDNFYLQHRFLTEVFTNFHENEQERILVISILGPRQSGKSTLLQYMFGIRNSKRLTKGLYGSLVKSNVDNFDYILVLDIEGLDQGDDEYDRRMIFFCMSISHIIILNVSNDIPDRFIDMLSICNDSLHRLDGIKCPSSIIHLVLNQTIISNKNIKQYKQNFESNTNLNLTLDGIHVLPIAFRRDFSSKRLYTEPNFCECTQDLCMKIIRSSSNINPTILSKWLNAAIEFFDILQETPIISYFQTLTERSHNDYIFDFIRRRVSQSLTDKDRQDLIQSVAANSSDEIDQIFNIHIRATENNLEYQIDDRLNLIKASKSVRERSKKFLQRHMIEILDECRQKAKNQADNHRPIRGGQVKSKNALESKSSQVRLD